MREPLKDRERLQHILAAIERVNRYVKGKSFDDLLIPNLNKTMIALPH